MERARGTSYGPYRLAVFVVAMTALAGCDESLFASEDPPQETEAESADNTNRFELFPAAASTNQRDVEAPEVFQVTEAGLWDGRPSLGGVWVAHPDVTQPERVRIKNTANNKSVTGALFRRERDLPGPALQVSSSAAEQLGMLAGAPARVQVVALRREAIEPPPAAVEAEPIDDAETTEDAETTGTADTSDTAAAEKPQKRKWWQKKPGNETAAAAATTAGAATAAAAETAAGAAAATTSPEPQAAALSDPELTAPAETPAKRKWWQRKERDAITETPLDPIAGAQAAIEASDPAAPAAGIAAAGGLAKPFVQAGTFSVESNALSAAEKIRRNGMTAEVVELKGADKSVWRVLVGPVATRAERRSMLNDVKDLGFADAFTTKN